MEKDLPSAKIRGRKGMKGGMECQSTINGMSCVEYSVGDNMGKFYFSGS